MPGVNSPEKLVPKRGKKLERLFEIRPQRGLALDPRLGMWQRFEDATSSSGPALNHAAVHQEQQDDGTLVQRHRRPVPGKHQVIFEVQPRVSDGVLEECQAVLVIAVRPVMSQPADPVASQMCDQ